MTEPLMKNKKGLIMGVANDHSIAWGIAQTLAQHGAEIAFTYQGEAFGKRVKPLAESIGSTHLIPCDVEDVDSQNAVFEYLEKEWGKSTFLSMLSDSPTETNSKGNTQTQPEPIFLKLW